MFLFRRRWLASTVLVILAAAVMVRLGFWQLDRLAAKRAYIAQTQAALAAAPLVLTGEETDLDAQALRHRPATVTGTYDFAHEILLKNKFYGNQPGYHLLTPLRIAGSERAVLVDRGWIPFDAASPEQVVAFREPADVTLQGRIEPEDPRPPGATLPTAPQREWYRLDIAGLQAQMPYELLPFYLALLPDDPPAGPPFRNPPEIILDEGPHLGYAFQWFLFAVVVPVVYIVQVRRIEARKTT